MASLIGSIVEFNGITDDWMVYRERLEQYFTANLIGETERRAAILLSLMGQETYKLLRDLCFPDLPSTKTYDQLCDLLKEHFSPKVSVYRERIAFYSAVQELGENVAQWHARLKKLAVNCKFADNLNSVLRDKFVCGMRKGPILDNLCESDFSEAVTLAMMVDVALRKEATLEARTLSTTPGVDIHWARSSTKSFGNNYPGRQQVGAGGTSKPPKNLRTPKSDDQGSKLYYCNCCGQRHQAGQECKFKNRECYVCKKVGHVAKVCKSAQKSQNYLQTADNAEEVAMYNFNAKDRRVEPLTAVINIDEIRLVMEIDSGAAISAISEQLYLDKFSKYVIKPCKLVIIGYTGTRSRPLGYFTARVKYGSETKEIDFYVISNGGPALLGRDWLKSFGLSLVKVANVAVKTLEVKDLETEFKNLFDGHLGCYKYGTISLKLKKDFRPVFCKPRPVPLAYKEKIETELERLEKEGVITPITNSQWGTPLVPVMKTDGNVRICADYKTTLNRHLEEVRYPLPRIEEIFASLQGGVEFSKVDLSEAYNQFRLDEESAMMAAWSTHKGLFKMNRLPYGVSPAAAIFQRQIEQLLQGISGVCNFLDDFIVTGRTREEHFENLRQVFQKLTEANLKVRWGKCAFFQKQVTYLGHVIDKNGIRKSKDKVEAILDAPAPQNATQVKSFAGMVNYYAKFVPRLSLLMGPIYELLKKDAEFSWSEDCANAFREIKNEIASDRILVHFDSKKPIVLTCDASQTGVAATLSHEFSDRSTRPIGFASRSLTRAEENYAMVDKEALAIFFGVKKFQQYLQGQKFVLKTDHKPLLAILGEHRGIPVMAASRLQRWAIFLSGFNYTIEYIKGTDNQPADYLSRSPLGHSNGLQTQNPNERGTYLNFIEEFGTPVDAGAIEVGTQSDEVLKKVLQYVRLGWPERVEEAEIKPYHHRRNELTVERGCIMWGFRVVIPTKLRFQLLQELHVGHLGIVKMKSVARSYIWWPGLDSDIERKAKACMGCLTTRDNPRRVEISPWPVPEAPWQRIHVDFLGPIRSSYFLVILDAYTKWVEVFKMTSITTEQTILRLRETFSRFGLPRLLVSDNGTQLVSAEFKDFLKRNGIEHVTSPTFYPASNGAAENAVRTFKKAMKAAMNDTERRKVPVEVLMHRFLLMYRNANHCTTKKSPAQMMLGRQLATRLDHIKRKKRNTEEDKVPITVETKFGRSPSFSVGEEIMVRDYRERNSVKWTAAVVKKKIGNVTYLCEVLDNQRIWKRHTNQIIRRLREVRVEEAMPKPSDSMIKKIGNFAESADPEVGTSNSAGTSENASASDPPSERSAPVRRGSRNRHVPERFGVTVAH